MRIDAFKGPGRAFTLVEVIVAVGITATAVLTVFALLVPARDGAREAALTAAAARLQPALVRDLREQGAESLFELVKGAGDAAFAIYQVRAVSDIERAPEEGDLEVAIEGNAGDDYVVVTVTRDLSDPARGRGGGNRYGRGGRIRFCRFVRIQCQRRTPTRWPARELR